MNTTKERFWMLPVLALSVGLIFAPLFLHGCATLDPNASPFIVHTEQVQASAKASVQFILSVDNFNRQFWITNAPALHNFCEYLRAPIPPANHSRATTIQLNVQTLKVRYKENRSAGNSNALYLVVSELDVLGAQANSWSNIVSLSSR